jgi:Transglycosylase SLT domain
MALKAIVDLELNDSAWTKFQAQYAKYETALKNSPAAWNAVNKEIDGSRASFDKLVGAASARLVQAKLTAEAEKVASDQLKRQSGEATSQARSWSSMAKDSKAFAGNVVNATKSLLRWAEVTGVVSGLLGAGGLFGIDRLAQSAAGQRKESSGIRVTPGELKSFDLNFNRLLNNPTGFLTGVSESLSDVTKAAPYGALGLNYARERQKTPADVAIDVLRAEKSLADRTPQSQLGNTFASRQLGMLGGSLEDFQRIKDRPLAELEEYFKSNQRDKSALNLDQGQLKAWEDFKVKLGRAGEQIEKTFIVALTPLAPQLGKLSTSVTGLVDAFLRNPDTAKWLDEAAAGIGTFADYIGTPKFKTDVGDFVKGIGDLARSIGNGLKWLGIIPDKSDVPATTPAPRPELGPADKILPAPGERPWWAPKPGQKPYFQPFKKDAPGSSGGSFNDYKNVFPGAYRPTMGKYTGGITPALLASVEWEESRGKDVTNRSSGAAGYFQFMPGTARQYGVNPHNEQSSMDGARRYLGDLKKQFDGDTEKALAAYNWGPGNLKKDIARYGEQWRDHLPAETKKYVSDITGRLPKEAPAHAPAAQPYGHAHPDRSMRVIIHNNTGGNAHVTASQLSA